MLKGSLAHMASSSIGCTPSEITIKKNRYGFVNDSYVAQSEGEDLLLHDKQMFVEAILQIQNVRNQCHNMMLRSENGL